MSRQRLQKLIARAGVASRRKSETLIRQRRVTVNGRVAELGESADPTRDVVKVDGRRLRISPPRHYLLLNKPSGYLTTRSDPEGRATVYDLLPRRFRRRVVPVGRLDYDTEGLLLLTDDGDFAERIAHPRFGCVKAYEVKVKGMPDEDSLDRLRRGLVIAGRRTMPAQITELRRRVGVRQAEASSWWRVALREGRTRQIREMFERIGHPVRRLRRVAIGGISDSRLPRGAWRELATAERERLLSGRRPRGGKG